VHAENLANMDHWVTDNKAIYPGADYYRLSERQFTIPRFDEGGLGGKNGF